MLPESERPHPRRSYRGGVHLHNAADSRTVGKHVIVVIVPLAGWAACLGRLEDQRGHGAAFNRLALTARMDPAENSLRGYFRTDRYKWAGAGAAGARSRSLVDECDGTSARAAVCGDEHFILVTCRCTCTRAAIDTDNAKRICSGRTCWSRRTGLAFFASRTSCPRRSWFSFFARWTRGARFSLWSLGALTAARRAKRERNYESNAFGSHNSHLGDVHNLGHRG